MKGKDYFESIVQDTILIMPYGSGKLRTFSGKDYFLKTGASSSTYRCEANGLKELAKPDAIGIACPISVGDDYILTEYIERGVPSTSFYEEFGRSFARMHRYKSSSFGFYEDNFIGLNPQLNIPTAEERNDWALFYFNKRLFYQYEKAEQNGYVSGELRKGFIKLGNKIESILKDSQEEPTLLHGDLWSGNYICNEQGDSVLIDPAVYYGHREADLAMTKLFGGFPCSFYRAYQQEYPLQDGWEHRESIYKLYHVLNHLNLFGKSYLSEAEYLLSVLG